MPSSTYSASGRSTRSYSRATSSFSSSSSTATNPTRTKKQFFPIAYPPPLKTPPCLRRLTPKLLLQIQQLSTTPDNSRHRHIPVLEVWQPSIFNSRVTPSKVVPKIGSRDVYVTQCEGYIHLQSPGDRGLLGEEGDGESTGKIGEDQPERNVVSVLCSGDEQSDSGSSWRFGPKSTVYFADAGIGWEASSVHTPGVFYRLRGRDRVLEWGKDSRQDRFVLRIPDQRRMIASMTRTTIEVNAWGREVRDYLREALVSSGNGDVDVDARLCTLILTSGVWVAGQEGWFIN